MKPRRFPKIAVPFRGFELVGWAEQFNHADQPARLIADFNPPFDLFLHEDPYGFGGGGRRRN